MCDTSMIIMMMVVKLSSWSSIRNHLMTRLPVVQLVTKVIMSLSDEGGQDGQGGHVDS